MLVLSSTEARFTNQFVATISLLYGVVPARRTVLFSTEHAKPASAAGHAIVQLTPSSKIQGSDPCDPQLQCLKQSTQWDLVDEGQVAHSIVTIN